MNAGLAIKAAIERGAQHRAASARKLYVRVTPYSGEDPAAGLTIRVTIAARHNAEMVAQTGKGLRFVPWHELDARAGELVALVDEAVAEIELAVRTAPPPAVRPSHADPDFDFDAFCAFQVFVEKSITEAATVCDDHAVARHLSPKARSEAVLCAALRLAALASWSGGIEPDDLKEELGVALSEVQSREKARVIPAGSAPGTNSIN